jgi:aquaporin Z
VILAGPVSGFGMNPARTFASALPSHTWTAIWIYMVVPVISMLCAAELFLSYRKRALHKKRKALLREYFNRYKQNSYI